jgi:hypothetical protein
MSTDKFRPSRQTKPKTKDLVKVQRQDQLEIVRLLNKIIEQKYY